MNRIPKGVFDVLPDDEQTWRQTHLWQFLENKIRALTSRYCYRELRTPLFESTDLFSRSIGEETDIVSKEMYTFTDKGGRSLTLRPEGTASAMRAYVEKHLGEKGGLQKLYYLSPMCRYERQQAGRYRQHHQFGVEAIGSSNPCLDAEVIDLLFTLLSELGLKNLTLQINSIGKPSVRREYVAALKTYLEPKLDSLSADSQRRLTTNPLRILDSKDKNDQKVLEKAPTILDFLSKDSQTHFEKVLEFLTKREIPFVINPFLVRGLDYYNDTVFEITSEDLGAQNSLGGGGRYDSLIKQLGGPETPAFGFGSGIERILQTLIKQNVPLPEKPTPQLLIIPVGDAVLSELFLLLCHLRDKGVECEIELSGRRLKTIMRQANDLKIPYITVIGDDDLTNGTVELKEMASGKTWGLTFKELEARFPICTT